MGKIKGRRVGDIYSWFEVIVGLDLRRAQTLDSWEVWHDTCQEALWHFAIAKEVFTENPGKQREKYFAHMSGPQKACLTENTEFLTQ